MATKLRNLNVKKVDFVDEGANQQADIKLFKRRGEGELSPQKEPALKRFVAAFAKMAGLYDEAILFNGACAFDGANDFNSGREDL